MQDNAIVKMNPAHLYCFLCPGLLLANQDLQHRFVKYKEIIFFLNGSLLTLIIATIPGLTAGFLVAHFSYTFQGCFGFSRAPCYSSCCQWGQYLPVTLDTLPWCTSNTTTKVTFPFKCKWIQLDVKPNMYMRVFLFRPAAVKNPEGLTR